MRKYGVENFAVVELARLAKGTDRKTLCEMEKLYIAQENTMRPNGYNLTVGGDGMVKGALNPNTGKKRTVEARAKIKAGWTPERKIKAAGTMNANRNRADVQEKLKAYHASDEAKKSKSSESWSPERRAKAAARMIENNKKGYASEEAQAGRKARLAEVSRRPHNRERQAERMKKMRAEHPEYHEIQREKVKALWAAKRSVLQ